MTTINRKLIISDALVDESIKARPIWKLMHMQSVFKDSIFIEKARKIIAAQYMKMVFAYHPVLTFLLQIKIVLLTSYYP